MTPSHVDSRRVELAMGGVRLCDGRRRARGRECGAVLVHVAVAMMGLLAFSALSIDLGTLWVARGEAQNAADAAALSGAIAMTAVDPSTEAGQSAVRGAVDTIAAQHRIWGETVDAASSLQVESGPGACAGVPGDCVRVRVQRGGGSGSPLPVFFSRLFGLGSTTVAAYASARAAVGNATGCPSPIAISDRWVDSYPDPADTDWTEYDTYDRYIDAGFSTPPPNADSYTPPGPSGTGTGFTRDAIGQTFRWERHVLDAGGPLRAWQFLSMDLRPAGSGASALDQYRAGMLSCSQYPLAIGDQVPIFFGAREEIREPIRTLVDMDPGAEWNGTQIVNGNPAFPVTPRLLVVAVFDPDEFARQVRGTGSDVHVTIRNFVGVFVLPEGEMELAGVVLPASGTFNADADTVDADASFLRSIALVR